MKYNKLFYILIGFLLSVLFSISTFAYAGSTIKLIIDGKQIISDSLPTVINGRVLIPVRTIAENLGVKVDWDQKSNSVIVQSKSYQQNTDNAQLVNKYKSKEFKTGVIIKELGREYSIKIDRSQLPNEMKGFTKIENAGVSNFSTDSLAQIFETKGIWSYPYNDTIEMCESCPSKYVVVCIYDDNNTLLGYYLLTRDI